MSLLMTFHPRLLCTLHQSFITDIVLALT